MNNNISIKGIVNKSSLSNTSLQNMSIHTLNGCINLSSPIDDLFEISILGEIETTSSIDFSDMQLNIFNCIFTFKIIGIDNLNKGVFFNYNYNCSINYKSFNSLADYNLLILDCYFYKLSNININFSLIVALDFSSNNDLSMPNLNPLKSANKNIVNPETTLLFNKEFI